MPAAQPRRLDAPERASAKSGHFFPVGVNERNRLHLPTFAFLIDGTDVVVSSDIGMILTEPLPREIPPFLPLSFFADLFKTPTVWGVRHTAPYFHDNSARTLEEVAEQYEFFFRTSFGLQLTPRDKAAICGLPQASLMSAVRSCFGGKVAVFIWNLVGLGCRMMVRGPRLGTLGGPLEPTPMCAYQAHIVIP